MSDGKLDLQKREVKGKKVAKLRQDGLIPSVIYGGKSDPVLTQSVYNETEKVVKKAGYHSPVDLIIDGKKKLAMVKDVAVNPVTRRILNVSFQAISQNEIITAETPIVLVGLGESAAEKASLSILQVMDDIEVKAKPADLPESIKVSVAGLSALEDKITLADISLPDGVELADKELDMNQVVVNVYDPAVAAAKAEEEAAAEAALAAEASEDSAVDVPSEHGEEKEAESEEKKSE